MSNTLYMVGIMPRDLGRSLAFYRTLGVELVQDRERLHFTSRSPGEVVFFLNSTGLVAPDDTPRVVLEFRLPDVAAVDEAYALALRSNGRPYREPAVAPFGDYLAMLLDPDGNVVVLTTPKRGPAPPEDPG